MTRSARWFITVAEFRFTRKFLPVSQIAGLFLVTILLLFLRPNTYYDTVEAKVFQPPIVPLPIPAPSLTPFPLFIPYAQKEPYYTTAKSIVITDYDTNAILWQKNAQELLPPASLVKLLTALVALDHCNLEAIVKTALFTPLKTDESRMGLKENEQIRIKDLLYGLLLPSGGDAAQTLAVHCTNNEKTFVTLMNEKAGVLGMVDTNVINPTGQDEAGGVTTALDMAKLAKAAVSNAVIAEIVKTPAKVVMSADGTVSHTLTNTNVLLRQDKSVIGVKTGTTDNAGQNFIALFALAKGQKIFVVVLGSDDRFAEVTRLRQWVRENFEWKLPAPLPLVTL